MSREDILADAIVLPSRFVYAIKNAQTLEELYKARQTAGGHCDFMKIMMIHDFSNVRHASVRLVSSTAANLGWIIWTTDAIKGYIQGKYMTRFIVLIPPPELELPPDIVLKVCNFLYGISEAGDAWHQKLRGEISAKLNMGSSIGDQVLYMDGPQSDEDRRTNPGDSLTDIKVVETTRKTGHCDGLLGTYVDDFLFSGTPEFKKTKWTY